MINSCLINNFHTNNFEEIPGVAIVNSHAQLLIARAEKKLRAMRADILPRITHFWGHFGPKIPHFCRDFEAGIEDRQFKIEDEDWRSIEDDD